MTCTMSHMTHLSFLSDTRPISPDAHGFLPRWSCLSNLQVFKEAATRMMDEGHTVDVIHLGFANATDSVNRRFLLAKMKSFGFGDVVVPFWTGLERTSLWGTLGGHSNAQ